MKIKIVITLILAINSFYYVTSQKSPESDDTTADMTEEEVTDVTEPNELICSKCKCKDKAVYCIDLGLKELYSVEEFDGINDMDFVSLEHNKITEVAKFPTLAVSVLKLSNNLIETIAKNAFENLTKLEELDLSHNKLTYKTLLPEIFEGKYDPTDLQPLRALKTLNLAHNELHSLDPDVFEHLPILETLYLNDNAFMVIDQGSLMAISNIPQLAFLDLSNMELKKLPEHIFHTPRELKTLNLTGNLFTEIPDAIQFAINLKFLNFDANPIESFNDTNIFPVLEHLEYLSISFMQTLKFIGKGALSGFASLRRLDCKENPHLSFIHPEALSRNGKQDERRLEWPIIEELNLSNNNLSILDSNLLARWDEIKDIDIRVNPWLCDCENQWLLDTLIPIIMKKTPEHSKQLVCNHPIQLMGTEISTLKDKNSKLRCDDKFGNHPEHDGTILVGILVGILIGIPITMGLLFVYKRGCFGLIGRPGAADFSRAFYKRAEMQEDFHI